MKDIADPVARPLPHVRIFNEGPMSFGTKIVTAEGSEVPGVTGLNIQFMPNKPVIATISLVTSGIDVEAHALLSVETLEACAAHYGYRLVPIDEE